MEHCFKTPPLPRHSEEGWTPRHLKVPVLGEDSGAEMAAPRNDAAFLLCHDQRLLPHIRTRVQEKYRPRRSRQQSHPAPGESCWILPRPSRKSQPLVPLVLSEVLKDCPTPTPCLPPAPTLHPNPGGSGAEVQETASPCSQHIRT